MPEEQSDHDALVRRGAWYPDPYGSVGEQRWYDGTKWTHEVRPTQTSEEPPRARVSRWDQWFDPPVRIEALAGVTVRIVPGDGKPLPGYDLVTEDNRIGSVSVGWGPGTPLATMVCAAGAWCLKKRRRLGWDLIIETSDGQQVGSYSGRRWLPGGTIWVTDTGKVDLRRPLPHRWSLRTTGTRKRLVDIRKVGIQGAPFALTIRSMPPGTSRDSYLILLTACAVVIAERTLPMPTVVGGCGG